MATSPTSPTDDSTTVEITSTEATRVISAPDGASEDTTLHISRTLIVVTDNQTGVISKTHFDTVAVEEHQDQDQDQDQEETGVLPEGDAAEVS